MRRVSPGRATCSPGRIRPGAFASLHRADECVRRHMIILHVQFAPKCSYSRYASRM